MRGRSIALAVIVSVSGLSPDLEEVHPQSVIDRPPSLSPVTVHPHPHHPHLSIALLPCFKPQTNYHRKTTTSKIATPLILAQAQVRGEMTYRQPVLRIQYFSGRHSATE